MENIPGSPEKPLSHLGQVTYFKYWENVVISYIYKNRFNDVITIQDIVNETFITPQDIAETLERLEFIEYDKLTYFFSFYYVKLF